MFDNHTTADNHTTTTRQPSHVKHTYRRTTRITNNRPTDKRHKSGPTKILEQFNRSFAARRYIVPTFLQTIVQTRSFRRRAFRRFTRLTPNLTSLHLTYVLSDAIPRATTNETRSNSETQSNSETTDNQNGTNGSDVCDPSSRTNSFPVHGSRSISLEIPICTTNSQTTSTSRTSVTRRATRPTQSTRSTHSTVQQIPPRERARRSDRL